MAAIRTALVDHRYGRRRAPVNSHVLGEELGVAPKTVLRDIEFMRDRLGYEIEWTSTAPFTFRLSKMPKPIL